MKKLLAFALAIGMTLPRPLNTVLRQQAAPDGVTIVLNGKITDSAECVYVNRDGEVLASAAFLQDAMGYVFTEGSEPGEYIVEAGAKSITFHDGKSCAAIENGGETQYLYLKAQPVTKKGTVYLPLHEIAAAANMKCTMKNRVYEIKPRRTDAPDVTIYLTRHGKTVYNTEHRIQGWCDSPLTDAGVEVAEKLGQGLKAEGITFASLYASDLGRQRQTAQIVTGEMGLDLPLRELNGLREICFGDWETKPESERDALFCELAGVPVVYMLYQDNKIYDYYVQTDTSGTAETAQAVFERMYDALETIVSENRQTPGCNVLAVTSGAAINMLLNAYGVSVREIPNAAVTYFYSTDGVLMLGQVGDTHFTAE